MSRTLSVVALSGCLALSGCITGAAIARKHRVTAPILAATVAADLVIGSLVIGQFDSISAPAAIASGIAFTAVDLGIGCVLGACAVLRP